MAEVLLPRMDIRGDFDGMWRLQRAAFRHCWVPAALLALLWAGLLALLLQRLGSADDLFVLVAQAEALVASPAFWRVLIAAGCVSTLLFCMIVVIVHGVATGAPIGLGRACARALRCWLRRMRPRATRCSWSPPCGPLRALTC